MGQAVLIPDFITMTLGFAVFLGGWWINHRFEFLQAFNIPEAVTGGLIAAVLLLVLYLTTAVELTFEMTTRDLFLVIFFAGIGLNARLSDLLSGGKPLVLLLGLTLVTILMQNLIGGLGAVLFDYPVQIGVLFGSASLIGGHGTAIAWAPDVAQATGLEGAPELGVAVATLGLVLAALVGGPIAKMLVEGRNLVPNRPEEELAVGLPIEDGVKPPPINHVTFMYAALALNVAVIAGYFLHQAIGATGLKLPLFVPCLIMGILLGNLHGVVFPRGYAISRTPALALINDFTLGAFLAMSLMSLQLWALADLGAAILAILTAQTLFAVLFVLYVLFPLLGGGYRAAVLAAGFGGFALGATPTAIANMTAVTKRYGPSPIAFVVLPLVSAFFVDLANAVVIQAIVNF
ncbi:MAG: sodium/glutamate symporter [Pseudomonadota bacterium]